MKLSAPKNVTFLVAVVLFFLALLGSFASISLLTSLNPWLYVAAFVLLALGVMLKDL